MVPDLQPGDSVSFWAEISGNDDSGLSVDGVREGDQIVIEDGSGTCAFEDNRLDVVVSLVASAAEVLKPAWKSQVSDMRRALTDKSRGTNGGKKRDACGQGIGGDGNYAEKEGGLVVCLPSRGATRRSTVGQEVLRRLDRILEGTEL
ncbi:MAG: hypothetical protein OXH69_04155 [Acidobacteria bacterium]|nr:hypothetical protein [Acidobacteriota bacterium]